MCQYFQNQRFKFCSSDFKEAPLLTTRDEAKLNPIIIKIIVILENWD
jgi:hypothetical protein